MKKILTILAVEAVAAFGVAMVQAGDEETAAATPWFDLENCGMCKHLNSEEGLMEHMQWENYNIPTGMISITTVDEGYEEKFERVNQKMAEAGAKLMAGEEMHLCGMCQSFGKIYMTGKVMDQEIETDAAHIWVMTSTDPEVIDMIHKHCNRTNAEYEKMLVEEEK